MNIDILTLFPEMFVPLNTSILGKAQEKGLIKINAVDIRDYTLDKHNKADDYPFGGGAGMVMLAEPVFRALRAVDGGNKKIIYMSPKGKVLGKDDVTRFASAGNLVILCGHYEGIDQRILDYWDVEEVSVGDYILTGGELPAMLLIDAVARLLPDVLGSSKAHDEESIYSGLLEYPQYTKPREFEGMEVPDVLVSGNHKLIHLWQFKKSLELTKERRPDLWKEFLAKREELTKDERKILDAVIGGN